MTAVWIALIAVFAALIPVFVLAQQKKGKANKDTGPYDGTSSYTADTSHTGSRDPGQHHHLTHDHSHHGGGHDGGGSDGGGGGGSD